MRKFFVAACFALTLLVLVPAPAAKADHGHGGYSGYGGGYGAPSCNGGFGYGSYNGGYGGGYGGGNAQYQTAIIPVYPGGIYQSYSFGGSPIGGYSNYGQIGSSFNARQYGAGYGHRNTLPRVQLRIGF